LDGEPFFNIGNGCEKPNIHFQGIYDCSWFPSRTHLRVSPGKIGGQMTSIKAIPGRAPLTKTPPLQKENANKIVWTPNIYIFFEKGKLTLSCNRGTFNFFKFIL